MNQTRFDQIDLLLEGALAVDPAARAAWLKEACGADETLRREVEALLKLEAEAAKLPDRADPAEVFAAEAAAFTGQQISHYRIEERLGVGGMGEVWRAHDEKLQRPVALKLLPAAFTADPQRVRRFEQEAVAASQLNHPNIITIFEVVQSGPIHFIATEYVAGQTLRALLTDGATTPPHPLPVIQALDIATQIASALAAAHGAHIIHRDIKPENVMLRQDGLVKVLDFGIARWKDEGGGMKDEGRDEGGRMRAEGKRPIHPSSFIPHPSLTAAGTILGTTSYMSPEQAQAQAVDQRTDIYSLGVVLYEMLTGCLPAAPPASTEQAAKLPAPPLFQVAPKVPRPVQRIVSRALAVVPAQRYQTAGELLNELKSLRQTLAERTITKRTGRRALLGLSLLMVATAVVVWFKWRPIASLRPPTVTRLIATGNVTEAAISPDGRYLAYLTGREAARALWLRDLTTHVDTQLLAARAGQEFEAPALPPGNQEVFFLAYESGSDTRTLYRLPLSGGVPRQVLVGIDSPVAFAPDGQQFVFVRNQRAQQQSALLVAETDGSHVRTLVTRAAPARLARESLAWSPDGQRIVFAAGTTGEQRDHRVYEYSLAQNREQLLSPLPWRVILGVAWLGQQNALAVLASDPENDQYRVWRLDLLAGERRGLTSELGVNSRLSVTADGKTIITIHMEDLQSLWVLPGTTAAQGRQLLLSSEAGRRGLAWTPDGQLLYAAHSNETPSLYSLNPAGNANGSQPQRLSFANDDTPTVTPDGSTIVFCSTTAEGRHLWRMNRDGSQRQQLTFSKDTQDVEPRCTPDGRWVVYVRWSAGHQATLWRLPLIGGEPVQLTGPTTANPSPALSPDGRWLAYYQRAPHEVQRKHIAILPLSGPSGHTPAKELAVPHSAYLLHWSPDGRGLDYADTVENAGNLWRLPLEGGRPRQLTDFKADVLSRFAWSHDGRQLAVSRLIRNHDVIMLRDF